MLPDPNFDVVCLGTGLTNSILVAALAKAGFSVAHIDSNDYYGSNEASLSLKEFVAKYPSISPVPQDLLRQSQSYSITLAPNVIPATGELIDNLVKSGVARYGGFRLVQKVGLYHADGTVKTVPGSKQDVFTNKTLSLVEKRRLMKFLMYAAGDGKDSFQLENPAEPFGEYLRREYQLKADIVHQLTYALGFCWSGTDPTLPCLVRIQRYLRSTGRYGPTPHLIAQYGSSGEIAQGFCRGAAVAGAVYILGRDIHQVSPRTSERKYSVALQRSKEDGDESLTLSCDLIVAEARYSSILSQVAEMQPVEQQSDELYSGCSVARCVAVLDRGLRFGADVTDETEAEEQDETRDLDTAILVFPPGCLGDNGLNVAVTALITGEGTMSVPKGSWLVHLSTPIAGTTPALETGTETKTEQILKPYLDALLVLTGPPVSEPLAVSYYVQPPARSFETTSSSIIISPDLAPSLALPEGSDTAATLAAELFWKVVKMLKPEDAEEIIELWPPLESQGDGDEDEF
ncbi:GDP dissociation inhibitor-domain-containing protein [Mycena floridula]|nr:GDP dissociation inhibitor-domain-containing protein [Mycena floridula]